MTLRHRPRLLYLMLGMLLAGCAAMAPTPRARLKGPTASCGQWACLVYTADVVDSDGDGVSDDDERRMGTDPFDPSSKPSTLEIFAYLRGRQLDSLNRGLSEIFLVPEIAPDGSRLMPEDVAAGRVNTLAQAGLSLNVIAGLGLSLSNGLVLAIADPGAPQRPAKGSSGPPALRVAGPIDIGLVSDGDAPRGGDNAGLTGAGSQAATDNQARDEPLIVGEVEKLPDGSLKQVSKTVDGTKVITTVTTFGGTDKYGNKIESTTVQTTQTYVDGKESVEKDVKTTTRYLSEKNEPIPSVTSRFTVGENGGKSRNPDHYPPLDALNPKDVGHKPGSSKVKHTDPDAAEQTRVYPLTPAQARKAWERLKGGNASDPGPRTDNPVTDAGPVTVRTGGLDPRIVLVDADQANYPLNRRLVVFIAAPRPNDGAVRNTDYGPPALHDIVPSSGKP